MRTRGFDFRPAALCGLALAGLSLVPLLGPLPAAAVPAAGMEKAFKACTVDNTDAAEQLKLCDAAIASGAFKSQKLAMALTFRGTARARQKDFTRALADFDAALRTGAETAQIHYFRGSALVALDDFDRALAAYDKAIDLAPNSNLLYRARSAVHSKRKDRAREIADLTSAIGLAPRPYVEYTLRGYAYQQSGERDKAIADYKKALEISPDYDLARESLGQIGAATPEALQLPPGKCGEADVSDQERAAACAAVIESGKLTGGPRAIAYCNLGYSLHELGQFDRIIEISTRAISLDPDSACAYLNRGRAWFYKKGLDQAIADYTQTIKLDSSFHEAYANRGTAYHERRDFKQAVENYNAAIAIDATIPMYFSDRGNSRMRMGDDNGAIADLTHAIELDPAYASAYARRGWAFLFIEDDARAKADFAKALELDPGNDYARAGREKVSAHATTPELAPDPENPSALDFDKFRRMVQQPHGAPAR